MTISIELTKPLTRAARVILVLCAILLPCLAQAPTAILVGRITDTTGAVTPDTTVEIRNLDTGVKWQVKTNASGYFTQPLLPPGNYQVTAQLEGFKAVTRTVTLVVDQIARLDFKLEVGAVTEAIMVLAAAPVLESGTASIGQVIQKKAVSDLPLNGRNYLDLARLAMGVAEPSTGDRAKAGGAFVANGVRADMNNFMLDGVDNNAKIVDLSSNSNVVIQPSVDAIQEFKVETNNFSAEYGYSAGAVVNATIKSGSNAFHGSAFEFLRNNQMDARDYFLPATSRKPVLQRNQYGAALGGPVIRNKTFFFGSWEGTRQNQGATLVTTLPSAALRSGTFTGAGVRPVFDPATLANNPNGAGFVRTQFPGNVIPASRIDPRSAKLTALIPDVNLPGVANNFVSNPIQVLKRDPIDFRVDQNFSDRDKVFVRYSHYNLSYVNPGPFAPPLVGSTAFQQSTNNQTGNEAAIGETHSFSGSLVNEFRAGYNRISNSLTPFVKEYLTQQYGFVNVPQQPGVTGLPNIIISGYSNLGENSFLPDAKGSDTAMVSDNLLWTHGTHFIKVGGMYRWVRSRFNIAGQARGQFNFSGVFTQNPQSQATTGNGFADFLLGDAGTAALASIFVGDLRYKYYGGFINDDWKVAPRLTLNLGVRYELWSPQFERHDLFGNFLIGPNKLIYPNNKAPSVIPASLVTTIPDGVDSRGLVSARRNNWSPRVGLAYQVGGHTVIRAGAGIFYAEPDAQGAAGRPAANPPFRIVTNYPTDQIHTNVTFQNGFPVNALNVQSVDTAATTFIAYSTGQKLPYIYHWSFSLQHQIGEFLLDANYVGTKGTHLSQVFDYNQPYAGAAGVSVASRRPVPGFGTITYQDPMANSEYNALQMRLERRYSNGMTVLASYTYSKSLDLGGGGLVADLALRNAQNVFAEHALASSDLRHRLVVSYLYDLPFGRGQRINISNPVLNLLAGNWQVNGITTLRSGQPFTPITGVNTANTTGNNRPNRIADGNLPADQQSVSRWFDKTAFVNAASPNYGNAGRNILFGPGAVNFDFSAFKGFRVRKMGEAGEVQFRAEFFNLFNHPQFGLPNARIDIPQGASITSLIASMRQIQLGIKVVF